MFLPSRHGGAHTRPANSADDKAFLGGVLVGGVGWIHRADEVLLLCAELDHYRPDEVEFLPYLEAGFLASQILLVACSAGRRAHFVSPLVREDNRAFVGHRFGNGKPFILCGAIAMGNPQPLLSSAPVFVELPPIEDPEDEEPDWSDDGWGDDWPDEDYDSWGDDIYDDDRSP